MLSTKFGTFKSLVFNIYDSCYLTREKCKFICIYYTEMSIIYFIIIYYFYNSYIVVTNSFIQILEPQVPNSILGNFSDILVDIGEDVLLECDGNDINDEIVSYEWYRKEENWFTQELSIERIFYNDKYLLVNENQVSTILYKCVTKTNTNSLIKSYKLYVDRVPKKQRGLDSILM